MERHARDIKGGSYSPTFFTMRIPNDENYENLFENERMSEQAEAYFVHEYIHFLQDLTTIPGLSNISVVVDYLKWATHQSKEGKLVVPCIPTKSDGSNLLTNRLMRKAILGHGILKEAKVAEIISISLNEDIVEIDGISFNHLNAIVRFRDEITGKNLCYQLGEHAISESMAYTIERIMYGNVLPEGYDCPYNIVKLVCDKFLPGFTDCSHRIVALCDACLMYSFPGCIFALALNILKKNDYKAMAPEDVYEIIVHDEELQQLEHDRNKGLSVNDHLEEYSLLAAEQLSDYFTTDFYDKEKKFSVVMLFEAMEIRKQHPHFFIDIAKGGRIRENMLLRRIIAELGCPVILNNTDYLVSLFGRSAFILNNGEFYDPSCFWVINQLYKIFKYGCLKEGTFRCEMIDWCRKSFEEKKWKDITSEGGNCLYSPWMRVSEEDIKQCSFGRFWKTIELAGVELVTI